MSPRIRPADASPGRTMFWYAQVALEKANAVLSRRRHCSFLWVCSRTLEPTTGRFANTRTCCLERRRIWLADAVPRRLCLADTRACGFANTRACGSDMWPMKGRDAVWRPIWIDVAPGSWDSLRRRPMNGPRVTWRQACSIENWTAYICPWIQQVSDL